MGLGSGGGTPIENYPAYSSAFYIQLLTGEDPSDYSAVDPNLPSKSYNPYNMMAMLQAAFAAGNPYDVAYAFDPADLLDATQTQFEAGLTEIEALDTDADWETFVDAALGKVADVIPDDTAIDTAVAAYRADAKPDYARAMNLFAGGMVEANAVGGSAFAIGVALMRSRFESDINRHRSSLETSSNRDKVLFVIQSVNEMMNSEKFRVGAYQDASRLQAEFNRIGIVANKEYLEQELSYEIERIYWDPGLFKFGGQALASITGIATSERGLNRTASAIAGGLTAGTQLAALGAQAGPQAAIALGLLGAFVGGYGGAVSA